MIYNLKNITVQGLYELDQKTFDDYMELKEMMLINDDVFARHKAKKLSSLTYGEVGRIKRLVKNGSSDSILEIFKLIYGIKRNIFMAENVVSYFYALKYVEKEILDLVEKEKKVLYSEPDPELVLAGSARLNVFGEMGTMISLARSFSTVPKEIEKWTYGFVFMILAYDKTHGEIQKRYSELKSK